MNQAIISLGLLDGTSCALLAAAAAVRARGFGAHITGSLVLGCLCGLIGPLLRESFLHGALGSGQVARAFPDEALVGAIGGIFALFLLRNSEKLRGKLFGWLDGPGIGLATGVGTICALPELGITGALAIGLINGLAPGLVRDMALGDTALLIDKSWYATAAAIGSVISIAVYTAICAGLRNDWAAGNPEAFAIICGFFAVLVIRAWRMQKNNEY